MPEDQAVVDALQRRGHVVGGYVLGEVIGLGGMGVIYSARQLALPRNVALKMPRPEVARDPNVARRFRTEARAGNQLRHANIVRVFDHGDSDGVPYLVMERMLGASLAERAGDHGPMALDAAAGLVGQILAGLGEAHGLEIVHADVKSDNVLVDDERDGGSVARLIDFGLARFCGERTVDDPALSGTPEYLAPEVIAGEPPTFASDLYAVGVVLYELLAGATPFGGGTSAEIMRRHLDEDAVPVSWRCPHAQLPAAIDELLRRALAKWPAARWSSARAFAQALEEAAGQGQPPRPPPAVPTWISTELPTAPLAMPWQPPTGSRVGQLRGAVGDAIALGDPGRIITAYLQLARALVDEHRLDVAASELEQATELLAGSPGAQSWRVLLTLAALYDGLGARDRARSSAHAARDQADRIGSATGRDRADQLVARLARGTRPTRPPAPGVRR